MAGLSLSSVFRSKIISGSLPIEEDLYERRKLALKPLSITVPDVREVDATFVKHPIPQCRLDTYIAGALCNIDPDEPTSFLDPAVGTCARKDGYEIGVRPRCWYKPR